MFDLGVFPKYRVRLIQQSEGAECGFVCVAMVANYYGFDIDMASMRRKFAPSARGATLRAVMDCADRIGLNTRALKLPLEGLSELRLPAILHWNMNHFVVLERVQKSKILVHDPAGRTRWIPLAEASNHFTGVALELHPGANFEPQTLRRKLRLKEVVGRIGGLTPAIAKAIILSLLIQVFVLALPYYTQLLVDTVISTSDTSLIVQLAVGFTLVVVANATAMIARDFLLLSVGSLVGFAVGVNICRKLFRLPIDWFERRDSGDVLSRFQSAQPIQRTLSEGAAAALIDGLFTIITFVVMIFYSKVLTLLTIAALSIYVVVRWMLYNAERSAENNAIVYSGREQTTLIESLKGITALRLTGRENVRVSLWQTRAIDAVNARAQQGRIAIWRAAFSSFLFSAESIWSLALATLLVVKGQFSVGMMFAFTAYKTQFLQASRGMVDRVASFAMLNVHLERMSDIAFAEDDDSFGPNAWRVTKLSGRITLSKVTFRYSPLDPIILRDINLEIAPGEHVAITGISGGGKSTLVKLVLGLLKPTSGTILYDGLPLVEFGHKSFHMQTGAVLQEDSLFSGSIADNIALFDEAPDYERIRSAAELASIHDDIMRMPMQYETYIGDMGSTLSGGQRQRLLVARAIYKRPALLVIDEGTSHLDAANERAVNAALRGLGVTVLTIAHRQETIANADRVLVLQDGGLVAAPEVALPVYVGGQA